MAVGGLTQAAAADCKLAQFAQLPIVMDDMRATVATKINGQDARFVLDTGAWFSMLTPAAAVQLKIHGEPAENLYVSGIGGDTNVAIGKARDMEFAGVPLKNVDFIIGGRDFGAKSVGLMGQNMLLSRADVEYDMANGAVRFFKTTGCGAADLAYWAPGMPGDSVSIDKPDQVNPKIVATAQINGKNVRVIFDTGSPSSIMTLAAAQRVGVSIDNSAVTNGGVGGGIGDHLVESWIAPIDSFQLGGEQIKHTRIRVSRMDLHNGDILLGMDFFLSHRILVDNTLHKLFFTYNGGPVFQLKASAYKSVVAQSGPEPTAVATVGKASEPAMDAAAYGRRAAASLSRLDLKSAIADYSKAIDLDRTNALYLVRRGEAYGEDHQIDLATADFDQALKLKPDDWEALFSRGRAHMAKDEKEAALRDYAAAAKAAPDNQMLRLSISDVYMREKRFPEAVAEIDGWLSVHTKYDELWSALNARCWTRAMWGRELDKALDDCNAALKKGGRSSDVLDSRGMVHLRRGDFAEALKDYDTVLKLQPKMPGSLLGRGLAKQELGDASGGEADVKAAAAESPGTVKEFKKFGVIDASGKLARQTSVASTH